MDFISQTISVAIEICLCKEYVDLTDPTFLDLNVRSILAKTDECSLGNNSEKKEARVKSEHSSCSTVCLTLAKPEYNSEILVPYLLEVGLYA